ncbi:MAG: inositol monophosphatase [Desulfobulbaceae bacterium]|nr:MAG: inositol monophosphatase [Desulfobulbaceae bacterium]
MRDFIKEIIKQAGEICRKGWQDDTSKKVHYKGPKDLVTIIDTQVETFLVEAIKAQYPTHEIIAEEGSGTVTTSDDRWYIDPIDGTTSYFHKQPYYCISVAYESAGLLTAAGVYAPALGQLFLAERGRGSTLNNDPLTVSSTATLENSVLATGFACLRSGLKENNLTILNRVLPEIRDIRRCGSAALDLCYVAAGKYDGFWEMNLNVYDIAAGVLMVQEAGGWVVDFKGFSNYPEHGIIASNQPLIGDLRALIAP